MICACDCEAEKEIAYYSVRVVLKPDVNVEDSVFSPSKVFKVSEYMFEDTYICLTLMHPHSHVYLNWDLVQEIHLSEVYEESSEEMSE